MIVVCPLSAVGTVVETYRPAGLVTLINADMMIDTPAGLDPRRHLKLSIHDIAAPSEGLVAAGEPDVRKLIDFIDDWDRSGPLAIHCWAGISRSTAAAFVALCRLNARHDVHAGVSGRRLRGRSGDRAASTRYSLRPDFTSSSRRKSGPSAAATEQVALGPGFHRDDEGGAEISGWRRG